MSARKYERNRAKCKAYKDVGRKESNKARRAAKEARKQAKRLAKKAKREEGKK